jgi:hypothetical protein
LCTCSSLSLTSWNDCIAAHCDQPSVDRCADLAQLKFLLSCHVHHTLDDGFADPHQGRRHFFSRLLGRKVQSRLKLIQTLTEPGVPVARGFDGAAPQQFDLLIRFRAEAIQALFDTLAKLIEPLIVSMT